MYGHPLTPPKPRWKSKTYLVNLAIVALAAAEMQLNFLQPLLPMNVYTLFVFALPIVNLVLREYTDRPVGKIKNPPPSAITYPAPPEPGHE